MTKYRDIIYISVIGIMCVLLFRSCNGRKSDGRMWQAMNDDLRKEVNAKGQEIARIKQINGERRKVMKALEVSNDSLHNALAQLIQEGGRRTESATIVHTTTEVITEVPVEVTEYDTIYIHSTDSVIIAPVYSATYEDEWISYMVKAHHDTLTFNSTYHNKLNMRFERKRKYIDVFVMDENPYTDINQMASWSINRKPKRFGIGVHLGYGIDVRGNINPHIGVGINYSIFQF